DNGRIINTVDELDDALNYYLFYLKNWNYAYAYSLKLIDAYASTTSCSACIVLTAMMSS
ncbi:accessory Sec system glycosyltransferase Asp1, partial [Staphylococcus sp. EG-SA-23]|uniref:accessory Sec system glycosyltransferase Asp1 n=1 Tax=Staphylococcus sp. EG-SA-23 TaxID=2767497 RepID=UPI00197E914B